MKKFLSFILTIVFLLGLVSVSTCAETPVLSATCSNYTVTFTVSGATIKSGTATPNGNNGTLDIVVSDVTDNITISPSFSNSTLQILGTNPTPVTLDVREGSANTNFAIMAMMGGPRPVASWQVNATVSLGDEPEVATLKMTTDLDTSEKKYICGQAASSLSVKAEHSEGKDVSYQWYKNDVKNTNGVAIDGETTENFIPDTTDIGTTYYYAVATSEDLTVTSKISTVVVEAPTLEIITDLDKTEVKYVENVTAAALKFVVEYTGVSENEVVYQWYKSAEKNTEGGIIITGASESTYVPETDEIGTVYYYATATIEGLSVTSKVATVTVLENKAPENAFWIGKETDNGSLNYVVLTDSDKNDISGLSAQINGIDITVMLPHGYPADGKVNASFNLTQNGSGLPFITTKTGTSGTSSGKAVNNKFTEKEIGLSGGKSTFTFYFYDAVPTVTKNNYTTYNLSFVLFNNAPTLSQKQEKAECCEVVAGNSYCIELPELFQDMDGDELTYSVTVNGSEPQKADANYTFTSDIGGTYELCFFASDLLTTSSESYKVILTVVNSTSTYEMSVSLPDDITPNFYITNGYDENGVDILGEELTFIKGDKSNGYAAYSVAVPENISEISVRDELFGGMAFYASPGPSVKLQKVSSKLVDLSDKEVLGNVNVSYGTHKAQGLNGNFLLVTDAEYTFSGTPNDTSVYKSTSQKIVLSQEVNEVKLEVSYNNPKTVITTSGAAAVLFKYESNYHIHKKYEPLSSVDNVDGTTTHYFSVSGNISYRVSMENKITKAGYMLSGNSVTVLYDDDDMLPTDRIDYSTSGTNASTVADDSILLNINQNNHLHLSVGATKTVKAYRAWEIINSYLNHIIQPDFHFEIVSGDDVVALTPYKNQPMTNSSGNWYTLSAIGEGTAVIEVTYDAICITGGSYDGFYGATDKARTGLFVVTVGDDATDVDFDIQCKTSAGSTVYKEENSKNWDSEFDTLYFFGDHGKISFSPASTHANILEVAVSQDKGENYTILEETDGLYTSPIFSGNNIIRVTTDKGFAYKIIRGDKAELLVKNVTNPGNPIAEGDTVSLTLMGLHTPIHKISGTYNPGFISNTDGDSSVHLNYSFGENIVKSKGVQYDFSKNGTTMEFTVPKDSDKSEFVLTDGYIALGVIGITGFSDDKDSHRNIPDSGGRTRDDKTTFTTRSLLPDITISVGMLPSGNTAPFIKEKATKNATLNLGGTFALSMSKIFADRENDTLTYRAKIDDGEASDVQDGYFTFTPEIIGTYILEFIANDGVVDSNAHTVTLTVKESLPPSSDKTPEYDILEEETCGYVKISFSDNGERVKDETNVTYPEALGTIISSTKVPFKAGDTVADVTLRLLDAKGFTYQHTGTTKSGFYLASIGDFTLKGITYDFFGEFDAGVGSGWMITLNDEFIEYGASEFEVEKGDVIKWQYTCQLGKDIGDPFYSEDVYIPPYNEETEEKSEDVSDKAEKNETEEDKIENKSTFTETTFDDVKVSDWFYDSVKYVYEINLMTGTDKGFEPQAQMTRAMLVTVLYRMSDKTLSEKEMSFVDVSSEDWFYDAVLWAYENSIAQGKDKNTFAPNDFITREEMTVILYRFAKIQGAKSSNEITLSEYDDAFQVSEWAVDAVKWATEKGVIKGTTVTTLSPKDTATRAQAATIIMRFCEMIEK